MMNLPTNCHLVVRCHNHVITRNRFPHYWPYKLWGKSGNRSVTGRLLSQGVDWEARFDVSLVITWTCCWINMRYDGNHRRYDPHVRWSWCNNLDQHTGDIWLLHGTNHFDDNHSQSLKHRPKMSCHIDIIFLTVFKIYITLLILFEIWYRNTHKSICYMIQNL